MVLTFTYILQFNTHFYDNVARGYINEFCSEERATLAHLQTPFQSFTLWNNREVSAELTQVIIALDHLIETILNYGVRWIIWNRSKMDFTLNYINWEISFGQSNRISSMGKNLKRRIKSLIDCQKLILWELILSGTARHKQAFRSFFERIKG